MPKIGCAFILSYFQDSPEFLVLVLICFILRSLHWITSYSLHKTLYHVLMVIYRYGLVPFLPSENKL